LTENIPPENIIALNELALRDPQGALDRLREYQSRFAQDPAFRLNSGGLLIDIGMDLARTDLVTEGIGILETFLEQPGHDRPDLFYNLANGYSALYNVERLVKGQDFYSDFDPDSTSLVQAKHYYRSALNQIDQLPRDLRTQLWVNYGNCLSNLGRAAEAISAYDQALWLCANHPMANGNLGVELSHFARIADHPILLLDAREKLERALSVENFEAYGGTRARAHFERARQQIDEALAQVELSQDAQTGSPPTCASEYEERYAEFCARHQLFLNFCLRCRRCERYARDSLSFSLVTDLDDNTSFIRLSRVINEIKERYAFARLLLFQSLHPLMDTIPIDDRTTYVDNLDYAVYGIRVASLKVAFESAYNVLDKMAHFINDYLRLGIAPGPRLTFTTNGRIWRKRKGGPLRLEVLETRNWHLFGLYDLARDLEVSYERPEQDGYRGKLRRTRNTLTHEYLVPHVEGIGWEVDADGPEQHLYYRELVQQTISLLQLVRAAIIYLMAFIDLEERKCRGVSEGLVAPMYTTRYDAALFTPALDDLMRFG
jgi:tetratricopeptide (TPR) repeat protein